MMTSEDPRSGESKLGRLILQQNPYGPAENIGTLLAQAAPADEQDTPKGSFEPKSRDAALGAAHAEGIKYIELDGPAAGHLDDDGDRLTYKDLALLRKNAPSGAWWYFDGRPRFVSKAMRIPYTYTIQNDKGESEQKLDWLLIGYQGAGW
jgi:hypothetical protein